MIDKNTLRQSLLQKRSNYKDIKIQNQKITENIFCFLNKYQLDQKNDISVIAVYQPINNEISLASLWEYCWLHNIFILSPRVISNTEMVFCSFLSINDLKQGYFNILEPITSPYEGSIDIMFVPGLSFDKSKMRLGYGAGFYDRFLIKHSVICTVGICDERLLVDRLPIEEHDQAMDFIITDQGIY